MNWTRRNLKILVPLGVAAVALVAYLAFAVFGVQTLFIDDRVDDAGPTFDSGAAAESAGDETPAPATSAPPASTAPPAAASTAAPADDTPQAEADEAPPATDPPATTAPPATAAPEPQVVTLNEGSFIPHGRYSGEGQALVLNDGSTQRFLRFENFSTDNGPDLNVYLVNSDANADEGTFDDDFVDLGNLRGNIGDQNYEIPTEVDLAVYDTVVVWCVRFGSAFTAADLMPA